MSTELPRPTAARIERSSVSASAVSKLPMFEPRKTTRSERRRGLREMRRGHLHRWPVRAARPAPGTARRARDACSSADADTSTRWTCSACRCRAPSSVTNFSPLPGPTRRLPIRDQRAHESPMHTSTASAARPWQCGTTADGRSLRTASNRAGRRGSAWATAGVCAAGAPPPRARRGLAACQFEWAQRNVA